MLYIVLIHFLSLHNTYATLSFKHIGLTRWHRHHSACTVLQHDEDLIDIHCGTEDLADVLTLSRATAQYCATAIHVLMTTVYMCLATQLTIV